MLWMLTVARCASRSMKVILMSCVGNQIDAWAEQKILLIFEAISFVFGDDK